MTRNVRGKAVESRVAMPRQRMAKDKNTEGGNAKKPSGDPISKPRRSAAAFDGRITAIEDHHDKLKNVAKQDGIHHKSDNMKSEDQSKMGKGKEVGHVTEKKGTPNYGRKRH